jgi:hypothetical protein
MEVWYLALFVVILFLAYYMYHIRESFAVSTGSYYDYVTGLMSGGVPFSRVYTKDAYNIVKSSSTPDKTATLMAEMNY